MEVRIRLQKAGANTKNRHNYRIVAVPKSESRQTKALEILGYYDSGKEPVFYGIKMERLESWVKRGAQMSDTVRSLVRRAQKASTKTAA
jgi:small subunit ribosomal protein S16